MQSFMSLHTRAKLFLGLLLILVVLAIIIGTAYVNMTNMVRSQERLYKEDFSAAVALKDIRENQNGVREDMMIMMLVKGNSAEQKARLQDA